MGAPLVLSIGEVLIDLIAADGATELENAASFVARPGGAPANAAVALARLGVPSGFCGVIGADPFGIKLRRTLAAAKVDVTRLRSTEAADTTIAFAWKDLRGDGHFRLLRLADRLLDRDDIVAAGIDESAAIVVGSVSLSAEPSRSAVTEAVRIASRAGVPICFDVNVRPTLWPDVAAANAACAPIFERATLLKLSLDDARFLFRPDITPDAAIDRCLATAAAFVVLTDGARGAWFASGGASSTATERFVPAFDVDAIEPTGAGDAFTAATVSKLLANRWQSLSRDDVRFASATGALTTTRRGAIEALPILSEVEAFLSVR
jgi:fructokinase